MFTLKKQEKYFYGKNGGKILKILPNRVKLNLECSII